MVTKRTNEVQTLEARLASLAWSLVSDIHDAALIEAPNQPRTSIEIARLATLNSILKHRFSSDYLGKDRNDLYLTQISSESERSGLSSLDILDATRTIVESYPISFVEKIQRLDLHDFILLLSQVHSIGSYNLPKSLNHGSDQHILGAFYTPKSIADYIVRLTLLPTLEKILGTIKGSPNQNLEDYLNLNVIDPACGSGIFLVSVFQLLQDYKKSVRKKTREAGISEDELGEHFHNYSPQIYGVDLDLSALEVADISLRLLECRQSTKLSKSHFGIQLKRGNSLISSTEFQNQEENRQYFTSPKDYHPFNWKKEFPEVMANEGRGFDFVVMNPPYERLKPNLAEFLRERLLSGEEQIQMNAFNHHKTRMREMSQYFRNSGEYKYATSYSLNTYQLFIERALQITREGGVVGCIVPSNILCDISAQSLRNHLFLENRMHVIDCFPETSHIFPDVTQAVSILTVTKGDSTTDFKIGFNYQSLPEAAEKKRLLLNINRIRETIGQSLVIPQIDERSYKLLDLIHRYPSLDSYSQLSINRGELDLTTDKNLFSSKITPTPLIRGSQISRYELVIGRHNPKFVDLESLRTSLASSRRVKHIDMDRVACQQISNMNQRWRLKFAPIPSGSVLANSCNYITYDQTGKNGLADYLLGLLNSELLNWRFQITNSNNHVSIRELQSLPLVPFNPKNEFVKGLSKAVRCYRLKETDMASLIEGYAFALYDFKLSDVKLLLKMRNCPPDEQKLIIQHFNDIT